MRRRVLMIVVTVVALGSMLCRGSDTAECSICWTIGVQEVEE